MQRRLSAWRRASDEAERANGEAGRARTAAARAEQVVALLEKLLGSADPHALKGPDYRVRQLLDDFDREFTDQLEGEPEVEASLRATLAESFLGLGLAEPARAHAERAKALRLELFGAQSPEHAASLLLESSVLHVDGLYEDALAVCAQAVELLRALDPDRSEQLAMAVLQQGDLAWHLSRGEEADAAFQEVIQLAGELGDESLVTTAMERLGVVYETQGRLEDAELAFRQVLERRKGMERGESMELAGTCAGLAGVLVPRGELDEAREYAQEAVRIARSAAGGTHPSVAHHMATLAGVWTARGELERAAATLEEAAGIQREVSGDASPALADILRSLARTETMLTRTDSGLRHATEALAMRQALGDEGSASIASDHLVLSGALAQSMRLQQAEEHARAALEIRLQVFGDDHRDTAQARYELGCILDQRGQRDAAASELSEALRILGESGDENEILRADTEHALAVVLLGAGRAGEAEPHVAAALEARIRIHGEGSSLALDSKLLLAQVHAALGTADGELVVLQELMEDESPAGAQRLMRLGRTLRKRGELAAADESIRAALRLQERLLPADHADIATSINELGQLLRAQGRLDEAVIELERAAEIYRSQGGEADAWLASTWVTLGLVHLERDDARAAERCSRDALEILRSGADPLPLASAAALLGQCLLALERAAEAEPLLRESLEIRRERIPDDWQRYSTESLLGAALLAQGETAEAEPLLVQAAEKIRPPPSQMDRRRQAIARVIALYEATSRPEQAATWRRELGELESAR